MPDTLPDEGKVASVPIDKLIIDWRFQLRTALHDPAVKNYKMRYETGATMEPLDVAEVGGSYYLINGFHRREALKLIGRIDATVRIRAFDTIEAAMLAGFHQNNKRSVPYTKDEWRRGFKLYIEAGLYVDPVNGKMKSYRKIGQEFGLFHTTVSKLIKGIDHRLWEIMEKRHGSDELVALPSTLKRPRPLVAEEMIKQDLNNARGRFPALESPDAKARIVAQAQAVADAMKSEATWNPFNEDF